MRAAGALRSTRRLRVLTGGREVYRAHDTRLNRDVALKILPDAFAHDPERLARFKREAQVLASLSHSNIAHVYGVEDSTAGPALVMELVDGPTLAELTEKGTPEAESVLSRPRDSDVAARRGGGAPRSLKLDDALAIAREIVDALDTAHEHGVIHRDLKPANVKVKPDGTVKALDFGLAKAFGLGRGSLVPRSFSPDGSKLLVGPGTAPFDLHVVNLGEPRAIEPLLTAPFNENTGEISSDGRWIAYSSDESGRSEIYVRPFPGVNTARWQVSTQGGTRPLWSRDGRELAAS